MKVHSNLISAVFLHEVVSPDKGYRAEISMKLRHKNFVKFLRAAKKES